MRRLLLATVAPALVAAGSTAHAQLRWTPHHEAPQYPLFIPDGQDRLSGADGYHVDVTTFRGQEYTTRSGHSQIVGRDGVLYVLSTGIGTGVAGAFSWPGQPVEGTLSGFIAQVGQAAREGDYASPEVDEIFAWLASHGGARPVVFMGHSYGAATALKLGANGVARGLDVRGVVASAPPRLAFDLYLDALRAAHVPVTAIINPEDVVTHFGFSPGAEMALRLSAAPNVSLIPVRPAGRRPSLLETLLSDHTNENHSAEGLYASSVFFGTPGPSGALYQIAKRPSTGRFIGLERALLPNVAANLIDPRRTDALKAFPTRWDAEASPSPYMFVGGPDPDLFVEADRLYRHRLMIGQALTATPTPPAPTSWTQRWLPSWGCGSR